MFTSTRGHAALAASNRQAGRRQHVLGTRTSICSLGITSEQRQLHGRSLPIETIPRRDHQGRACGWQQRDLSRWQDHKNICFNGGRAETMEVPSIAGQCELDRAGCVVYLSPALRCATDDKAREARHERSEAPTSLQPPHPLSAALFSEADRDDHRESSASISRPHARRLQRERHHLLPRLGGLAGPARIRN